MRFLRVIKMVLTLSCDDSSRLLSDDMERPLTISERAAVSLHIMVCRACRRFRRDIHFLRTLFRRNLEDPSNMGECSPPLTPEERQRIHAAVRDDQAKNG